MNPLKRKEICIICVHNSTSVRCQESAYVFTSISSVTRNERNYTNMRSW